MMFRGIRGLVRETTDKLGITSRVEQGMALLCWDEVVGRDISSHTEPSSIRKGTLFVDTDSAVWAQELSYMKSELIDKLNEKAGKEVVVNIRFKPRGIKKDNIIQLKDVKRSSKRDRKDVKLSNKERARIEEVVAAIADKDLRNKIKKVLILDKKAERMKERARKNSEPGPN